MTLLTSTFKALTNPIGALSSLGASMLPTKKKPTGVKPTTTASLGAPLTSSGLSSAAQSGALKFNTPVTPATFKPQPKPQITSGGSIPSPYSPVQTPSLPPNPTQGMSPGQIADMEHEQNRSSRGGASTSPQMPALPTLDPSYVKSYETAAKAYEKSLLLSPEELSTQGELDNVIESFKKGYTGIKGKPIPMEFITGQLSALEERAVNLAEPLESKLARLQAQRLASVDASRFSLEHAEKRLTDARTEVKDMREEAMGKVVGDSILRFNPNTGSYDSLYTAPDDKRSAMYQEFLDAKKEGYGGSFTQYQNEDANRKAKSSGIGAGGTSSLAASIMANPGLFNSLTPTARTAIIPELVAAGFQVPAQLTGTQEGDIADMRTLQGLAQQILGFGSSGQLPGVGGFGGGTIAGFASKQLGTGQEGESIRNIIGNIKGTIAKLRGGTSFTPNEQTLLDTYTPTINDSDATILTKLNGLKAFLASKEQNLLSVSTQAQNAGVQPMGGGDDYQAYLNAIGQ